MRRGWKLGFGATAILAAALAVLVGFRIQLIEVLARREFAALGLADASFRAEAAGLSEARVVDLRLGPEAQADAVVLRYGLLPPRLTRIEIAGLFLDASHPNEGLLGRLGGGGGGGALPEIALQDARVEAETPLGRGAVAFSGSYGPDGGRATGEFRVDGLDAHGRFSVALSGPFDAGGYDFKGEIIEAALAGRQIWKAAAEAAVLVEDGVVAIDGDLAVAASTALGPTTAKLPFAARIEPARLTFRVEDGEAAAQESGLAAQGLSLSLVRAERMELRFAARSVTSGFVAPVALDGQATEDADGFTFEVAAKAEGATLSGQGSHDLATGRGQAQFELPPVAFAPGGLQPAALVPALASIEQAAGAVGGGATLRWDSDALGGSGDLRFDHLSFQAAGAGIEGLAGAVRFSELLPPTTPARQTLRARRIDAGAALEDVSLAFRLDGGAGALEIARLKADFAGGALTVANARIEPLGRNSLVVQVYDVDLAALLALIGLEGLTGEGRVNGALPLVVTPDDVLVEGADVAATGPGRLSFRSAEAKQALAAGGDYVGLALEALEDFRYEKLSLTLDKAVGGRAVARLSTLGSNPEVLDGHPFAINVTLNADANALLAQALEAWRLSQGALATIVRGP